MANYVKLKDNVVVNSIVAEQDFIETLEDKDTYKSAGNQLVSVGWTFDTTNNIFYPPQPYPSWSWSNDTLQWEAPIPRPDDDMLCDDTHCKCTVWNEATKTWDRLHRTMEENWTFDE